MKKRGRYPINPDKMHYYEFPLHDGESLRLFGSINQFKKYLHFTAAMINELKIKHWSEIKSKEVDISFGYGRGSWEKNRVKNMGGSCD